MSSDGFESLSRHDSTRPETAGERHDSKSLESTAERKDSPESMRVESEKRKLRSDARQMAEQDARLKEGDDQITWEDYDRIGEELLTKIETIQSSDTPPKEKAQTIESMAKLTPLESQVLLHLPIPGIKQIDGTVVRKIGEFSTLGPAERKNIIALLGGLNGSRGETPAVVPPTAEADVNTKVEFPPELGGYFGLIKDQDGYSTGFTFGKLRENFFDGSLVSRAGVDVIKDIQVTKVNDRQYLVTINLGIKGRMELNRGSIDIPLTIIDPNTKLAFIDYQSGWSMEKSRYYNRV